VLQFIVPNNAGKGTQATWEKLNQHVMNNSSGGGAAPLWKL